MHIPFWRLTVITLLTGVILHTSLAAPIKSNDYGWNKTSIYSADSATHHTIFTGQTASLSFLELQSVVVPAGKAAFQTRMLPDTEQLIIVKTGEITVKIENQTTTLGPGSIALILPGDRHRILNLGETSLEYFAMSYRSKQPMNDARGRQAGESFVVDFNDLEYHIIDRGGRHHYFDRPTSMTENFEMHVTTLNEGITSHPPHTHKDEEIILMMHGEAEELIDGKPHALAEGDLAFLDSMVPHGIRNTGTGTCRYFAFKWR